MDIDPGTVVANRYRISRPLGRGGMGEVFAAENIRTGRPVAVKLLRSDSKQKTSAVARFRREARAAGSINSDHVTQVLDVEEDQEHGIVLVFELLEGESLIDRLKRTGPINFDELHVIIDQVWMGLADAHRAGIIHRDLKPSNVFLERRPDGSVRVKILDFGISKLPKEMGGETLTEMGQSLGTFSFMPPEQIGKAKLVDHRADIYACATMIYQAMTGQLPYSARNILVMVEMKAKSDPRKLSDAMAGPTDPRIEAFLQRGLARDPGQRYQSAVEALMAWRELRPSAGPPPSREHRSPSGQMPAVSQPSSNQSPSQGPPRSISTTPMPNASSMQNGNPNPGAGPTPLSPTTVSKAVDPSISIDARSFLPSSVVGPIAEMTTDSAATLAFPAGQSALQAPMPRQTTPIAPSPMMAGAPSMSSGPQMNRAMGGTLHMQPPMIQQRPNEPTPPQGYPQQQQQPWSDRQGAGRTAPLHPQHGQSPPMPPLQRIIDEPTGGPNSSEQTTIYKPKKKELEPSPVSVTMNDNSFVFGRKKKGSPIAFILGAIAFAVVGFAIVATMLHYFSR